MKLISLWQPWATIMAIGVKRIETRHWSTEYRGWLAIHATLAWNAECRKAVCEDAFSDALEPHYATGHSLDGKWLKSLRAELPFGKIVAVVRAVTCVKTEMITGGLSRLALPNIEREVTFGDYEPGRFGIITGDVFRLPEPIAFKSRQGKLLNVPAAIVAQIQQQGWTAA